MTGSVSFTDLTDPQLQWRLVAWAFTVLLMGYLAFLALHYLKRVIVRNRNGLSRHLRQLASWVAVALAALGSPLLVLVGAGIIVDFLDGPPSLVEHPWLALVGGPLALLLGGLLFFEVLYRLRTNALRILWFLTGTGVVYLTSTLTGTALLSSTSIPQADGLAQAFRGPFPTALFLLATWLAYLGVQRMVPVLRSSRLNADARLIGVPHSASVRPPSSQASLSTRPRLGWDDVILPAETKRELRTIQRLIEAPQAFTQAFGTQVPRGLILHGPPGTGKTLVARTLAGASGYGFITASPADLHKMYLGESERAIQRLYEEARAHAPCIVFLDELDAIASRRSGGDADPGGAGRAQNSTVNQLLQELDGFKADDRLVFTVGATNRLDILDQAVLSRLAYHLHLGLPDTTGRTRLFERYTRGYRERLSYPIELLVEASAGLSGRDIATLCHSAALYAFGAHQKVVGYDAFAQACERLGRSSPARHPAPVDVVLTREEVQIRDERTRCPKCVGLGTVKAHGERDICPRCGGNGKIRVEHGA